MKDLPHSWQMTDEEYMEYHESREDLYGEYEPEPEESDEDTGDCPYCKNEVVCKGGCKNGIANYTPYTFERKEDED